MSRWMKLVFVNPDRVHSDEEGAHLLFDMTDPHQETEVRALCSALEEGLETAREYRSQRGIGPHLQAVLPSPQTTFPWGLAGRCEHCGGIEPCECCGSRDVLPVTTVTFVGEGESEWGLMWEALSKDPRNSGRVDPLAGWEYMGTEAEIHHFRHRDHPVSLQRETAQIMSGRPVGRGKLSIVPDQT